MRWKRPHGRRPDFDGRQAALGARPHVLSPVRTERRDGKLYVTVRFQRPSWQRILGADAQCERTFGLDAYGQDVYHWCDGQRTVRDVIRCFSGKTRISLSESEMSVTRFLRTLLSKGLIAMEMEKQR